LHTAIDVLQQEEGASESELAARIASKMDNVDIDSDSEAEDDVGHDSDGTVLYQLELEPGAGEAEFTFVTMGADDVALDMDIEAGYITQDELSDESEDDLDDSMYEKS
jgi:hypothetical protein